MSTTAQETVACASCTEQISQEDWEYNSFIGSLSEQPLCESCYESDPEYPSTLIRFVPAGVHEKIIFGEHNAYHGTIEEIHDSGLPRWGYEIFPEQWTGRVWRSSSGWRGYYETESVFHGLTKIEDGWMTGDYGDVPWKRDSHAFLQALGEGDIVPPAPIYVLFEPTSNVFSTATTILTKTTDVDKVREWLESSGYDLHRALT